MKQESVWLGRLILGLLLGGSRFAALPARGEVREEFHQTYALAENGRVTLDNVNGPVRITTWDRAEIKVDAVKRAKTREHLEAVKIEIEPKSDRIRIRTKYPETKSGWAWGWRNNNNSTSVDYTLTVPRLARLDHVANVNGRVEIDGVRGTIEASTVNGELTARALTADAELSSVNGRVEAAFDQVADAGSISLHTVNGKVVLTLPTSANADLTAGTVNGGIHTDHELTVKKNWPIGSELNGTLGKGGTRIKIKTVNGGIHIRRPDGK